MLSTVTKKGQITIPKPLRKALSLKKGERVAFRLVFPQGILILKKNSLVDSLFGAAAKGKKIKYVQLEKVRRQTGIKIGKKYQVRKKNG